MELWDFLFFVSFFWDLSPSVLTVFWHLLFWIVLPPTSHMLSSSSVFHPPQQPVTITTPYTLAIISNPVDVVLKKTTLCVVIHSRCDENPVYTFTSLSVIAEQIHFTKRIHNIEVNERQSATFECEVSFDNAIVSWYKDTWELRESPKYNFTSEGRRHFMVIRNVTIEDEGV